MTWPVADAKARFSELLDAAINEGPQVVSRRGVETAVVVPIAEWKRLKPPSSGRWSILCSILTVLTTCSSRRAGSSSFVRR